MTFRSRSLLIAAVGLWMAHPLPGQEPAPLMLDPGPQHGTAVQVSDNQRMADAVAGQLRQSAQLVGCVIHISFQDGTVDLEGTVPDEAQRMEVVRVVQHVPGVMRVRDSMTIVAVMPVQATGPAPGQPPGGTLPPALGGGQPPAQPIPPPLPPGVGAGEPVPVYQPPHPSQYDLNPPKMPPHAWPTYAPYNNYSRVGYPTKYPYQAWPFVGPFYPFPKVPLGWRSIKMEWEDGHWWYQKYATPHDWWRIRYW